MSSGIFDRDAKLIKAAHIFRKQEKRLTKKNETVQKCKDVIEKEFFRYLTDQDSHSGGVPYRLMRQWMEKHSECSQFIDSTYTPFFPTETLEDKIEYSYFTGCFDWKVKR